MRKKDSVQEPERIGRPPDNRRIDRWVMEQNYDGNGNLTHRPLDTQLQRQDGSPNQRPKDRGSPHSMQPPASEDQAVSEDSSNNGDNHSKLLSAEGEGGNRSRRMLFSRPEIYAQDSPTLPAIHVDPLDPEDQMIHMSLPASDDLEHELEEFSRLRRLGRFSDAFSLFDKRASHFLHNRYIRVQYGQCLFEAGELGRLAELAKEWEPKRYSASVDAMGALWMFLAWEAEAVTLQLWERRSFLEAALYMIQEAWPNLDSTEMALLGCLYRQGVISPAGPFLSDDWIDLCEHLVEDSMIWEFRDLVQWLVEVLDCGELVEQVCQRWLADGGRPENQDDSTLLALLDILATLSLTRMKKTEEKTKAETCFKLAHQYALELMARDETYAKSQPNLRWIMTNVIREDPEGFHSRDKITLDQTGGSGLFRSPLIFPSFFPPIFVPTEDETAEWAPRSHGVAGGSSETVQMVLRAAENLGDQRFKAGCLVELMYRGAESPGVVSTALVDHWTMTGNTKERKKMHLFRYMLVNTDSARERLRLDILADGPFHDSPVLQSKQYGILRALSSSENDKRRYAKLIEGELESINALREMADSMSRILRGGLARQEGGNQQQPQPETDQEAGPEATPITSDYGQTLETIQALRKELTEEVNEMRRVRRSLEFEVKESQMARENLQLEKERLKLVLRQSEVSKPDGGVDNFTTALPSSGHSRQPQQDSVSTESVPGRERLASGMPSSEPITKESKGLSHAPDAGETGARIRGEKGDGNISAQGEMLVAESEDSHTEALEKQDSQKPAPKKVELESVSDQEEDAMGSGDGNASRLMKEIEGLREEKAALMQALEQQANKLELTHESYSAVEAKLVQYKEERDAALAAMDKKGRRGPSSSLEEFIKQNERAKQENARLGQPSFHQHSRPVDQTASTADTSANEPRRQEALYPKTEMLHQRADHQ
ncbi:hypothetical protein MCOR31_011810 [Pyricularia oryzae]|nr:hypothetical protein MCOR31_011810 [Pyricularia oryzae]